MLQRQILLVKLHFSTIMLLLASNWLEQTYWIFIIYTSLIMRDLNLSRTANAFFNCQSDWQLLICHIFVIINNLHNNCVK